MSERMNKERAIEQIKKLIEFTKKAREVIGTPQKDIEIVIGENQFYLSDELLQALDIAIESLQDEDLDISMDWLDEFIDWAKHRVEYTYKHFRDIIDIRMTDSELIRIIKILENYKSKVEPYERKE